MINGVDSKSNKPSHTRIIHLHIHPHTARVESASGPPPVSFNQGWHLVCFANYVVKFKQFSPENVISGMHTLNYEYLPAIQWLTRTSFGGKKVTGLQGGLTCQRKKSFTRIVFLKSTTHKIKMVVLTCFKICHLKLYISSTR